MPADSAFLAAIHAAPADDAPRLVYADYLAETGLPADAARAEFIRVQLALARLPPDHSRTSTLIARQADLLQQYHAGWTTAIRGLVSGAEFRRGLLDAVSVDAGQFLDVGEELFRRVPIRRIRLIDAGRHLDRLVASPLLGNVSELDLAGTELGNGGLNVFLRSPYLTAIESFDLSFNGLDDRGAIRLAESTTLPSLRSLVLTDNRIGSIGLRHLAESAGFPRIHLLDLTANAVGSDGVRAVADRWDNTLHTFRIGSNPLGDEGIANLVQSPFVARWLRHDPRLELRRTGLTLAGCAALAATTHLTAVVSLDLSENEIDAAGVRSLAAGHFPRLRALNLRGNQIDDDGAQTLARSSLMQTLAQIDLANNKLTQTGVDELLASRSSPKVTIDVSGNFIDL